MKNEPKKGRPGGARRKTRAPYYARFGLSEHSTVLRLGQDDGAGKVPPSLDMLFIQLG